MEHDHLTKHFEPLSRAEPTQLKSASGKTAEARKPVALDQQIVGRLTRAYIRSIRSSISGGS